MREFCDNIMTQYREFLDLNGKPTKRNPINSPYSFEPYVIWMNNYEKANNETVYSDRLYFWDFKKYNNCCDKIFGNKGQYFDDRKPEDIEKFLSMYFGREIKLTLIMKCCNVSSGFPYWRFDYKVA